MSGRAVDLCAARSTPHRDRRSHLCGLQPATTSTRTFSRRRSARRGATRSRAGVSLLRGGRGSVSSSTSSATQLELDPDAPRPDAEIRFASTMSNFDELRFERRFAENPNLALAECWYWIRKLQARFFAGDYAAASRRHRRRNGCCGRRRDCSRRRSIISTPRCPRGVCDRARRRAGTSRISKLWQPPPAARDLGGELSGEFRKPRRAGRRRDRPHRGPGARCRCASMNRPFARPAQTASSTTRRSPTNWPRASTRRAGSRDSRISICATRATAICAGAPTARCGNSMSYIRSSERRSRRPVRRARSGRRSNSLDLATVIKVSQAVSGEIVLEKLIDTLMRTAIEQAGAERGLLILPRGAEQRIEAEATTAAIQ